MGTEDTNGETDFSLQTITDNDILAGMSHTSFMSSNVTVNNKTTVKVGKFSGVETLKTFKSGTYTITVSVETKAGNLKLVLCNASEIIKEFEVNQVNQPYTFACTDSPSYLKVAGESAKYVITFEY